MPQGLQRRRIKPAGAVMGTVALVPVTGAPSDSHGPPVSKADYFSNWQSRFPPDQVITS